MKPLTKKVLEAGLVDKHAARMFEQWGQLEEGSSELVAKQKATKQSLEDFVDDLEILIEQKSEIKETRLEVNIARPPMDLYCRELGGLFSGVLDEMGRFIVAPKYKLRRGDYIYEADNNNPTWRVLDVEPLHQGDNLVAYQVTVEKSE